MQVATYHAYNYAYSLPDIRSCPCCGKALDITNKCIIDLNTNKLVHGKQVWHLTPMLTVFLFELRQSYPKMVSNEMMAQSLWGIMGPDNVLENLRTYASAGRRVVETFGADITVVVQRGYRLILPGDGNDRPWKHHKKGS